MLWSIAKTIFPITWAIACILALYEDYHIYIFYRKFIPSQKLSPCKVALRKITLGFLS